MNITAGNKHSSNKNTPVTETFYGYIETTRDSLLLFEACKRGLLPRITRRLQDKERILIRSGTIFCFDERESGIKRWTDGLVWSPSRIMGNFLIYRELQDKKLMRTHIDAGAMPFGKQDTAKNTGGYVIAPDLLRRQQEKALVGSLKTSFKFKRNGLIKKSMSLIVDGVQQHIISYYSKEDVLSSRLRTPSSLVELSSLKVSPSLRLRQNFRIPSFQQTSAEDTSITDDNDGFIQVTQGLNDKRKHSANYKSPSPISYTSSNSSIISPSSEPPPYSLNQESNLVFTSRDTHSNKNKGKERLYSLLPVIQHSPNNNASSSLQQPSIDLPLNILNTTSPSAANLSEIHFAASCKPNSVQQPNNSCFSNNSCATQQINKSMSTQHSLEPPTHSEIYPYANRPQTSNNISVDRNFSNTNNTSCHASNNMNSNNDYVLTHNQMGLIASGGYYAPHFKTHDYYEGQNPHQHLFSSSSFHAINHASILPSRNTDIIANAFMEDMNVLLGTGWNEFELQM